MFLAVPSTMFIAISTLLVFKSGSLVSAISCIVKASSVSTWGGTDKGRQKCSPTLHAPHWSQAWCHIWTDTILPGHQGRARRYEAACNKHATRTYPELVPCDLADLDLLWLTRASWDACCLAEQHRGGGRLQNEGEAPVLQVHCHRHPRESFKGTAPKSLHSRQRPPCTL